MLDHLNNCEDWDMQGYRYFRKHHGVYDDWLSKDDWLSDVEQQSV